MSHIDDGPLASYNSLLDPHLTGYFSNTRIRRHLRKSGLVTKRGSVVTETQYRLNAARKEHRKQVRELLATAIVNRTLDIERQRQSVIKRKLEEIAKVELVKRVKAEREKQKDAALLPLLSPNTGRKWPYFDATDSAADTAADGLLTAGGPRPPRERRGSAPTMAASSAASAALHRQSLFEPRPHTAGNFDDGHSPLFASTSGEPVTANVTAADTIRPQSAETPRSLMRLDLDASDRRAAFEDAGAAAGTEGGDADDIRLAAASPRQSDDGSGIRTVAARGRRQVTSVDDDGYPVLRRRDEASAIAQLNVTPRPPTAAAAVGGASSSSEPNAPLPPARIESSLSNETQRDGRNISPRRPRRRHFGGSAEAGGSGGGVGHPVHPLLAVSSEPIDTRHLWALDRTSLEKYNELLEQEQLGRLRSPYRENLAAAAGVSEPPLPPAPLQQPHPPVGPRRVPALQRRVVLPRDKGNSRAEGAAAERSGTAGLLMLHRLGPAFKEQELVQSFCEVTLRFFGAHPHPDRRRSAAAATAAAAASALDLRQEVLVEQQHCGGSTLVVFRALLLPKKDFVIISRRHRGYPFSLTFFVDGLLDARVSACCEYKHQSGYRLGGKSGHFGIVSVKGSAPCYKCQVERGLHISSAPPQPKWRFGSKASKGQQKLTNAITSDGAEQSAAQGDVNAQQPPQVADSEMTNYRDDFEADKDAAAERVALGASGDSSAEPQTAGDAQPSGHEYGTEANQTEDRLLNADVRPVVTSDSAAIATSEDGARAMQVDGAQSAYWGNANSDVEQNPVGGAAEETAATPVVAPLAYEDDFEEEPVDQGSERLAETTPRAPASDVDETEHAVRSARLPVDSGPTADNELTARTAALATSAPPRSRSASLSSSASRSSSLSSSDSSTFMSSSDSLDSLVTSSLLGLASLTSEQQSPPDVARVDRGSARPSSVEPTATPLPPPSPDTNAAAAAAASEHEVAVASPEVSDKSPLSAESSQSPDADRAVRSDNPGSEVFITQLHDGSPVVDGSAMQRDEGEKRDASPPAVGLQADVASGFEPPVAHESERRSASPVRRQSSVDDRTPEEQNESKAIKEMNEAHAEGAEEARAEGAEEAQAEGAEEAQAEGAEEAQAEGAEETQADGENDDGGAHSETTSSTNGENELTPKSSAPDIQQQAEEQTSSKTSKAHAVGDAPRSGSNDALLSDHYSATTKLEDIGDPVTIGDDGEQFNRGAARGGGESTDYRPKNDDAFASDQGARKEHRSGDADAASLTLVDHAGDSDYDDDAKARSPRRESPRDRSIDVGRAAIDGASPEAPASEPSDYLPLSISGSRGASPRMAGDSQSSASPRSDQEPPAGRGNVGDRAASPGGGSTSATSENETVDKVEASSVDRKDFDREWGSAPAVTAAHTPALDSSSAEAEPATKAEPQPEQQRQEQAGNAEAPVADDAEPGRPPPHTDARAALPVTILLPSDESFRHVDGSENVNDASLGHESISSPETKSSPTPPSPPSLVVPASPFIDSKASFPYATVGLTRPSSAVAEVERRDEHQTFESESATAAAVASPAKESARQEDNLLDPRQDRRNDDQQELHSSLPEAAHPGELAKEAQRTSNWAVEGRAADADKLQRTAAADLNDTERRQAQIEQVRPPPSESPVEEAFVSSAANADADDSTAALGDSDGHAAVGDQVQSNAKVAVTVLEPPSGRVADVSIESINHVLPNASADRVVSDVESRLEVEQQMDERNARESAVMVASDVESRLEVQQKDERNARESAVMVASGVESRLEVQQTDERNARESAAMVASDVESRLEVQQTDERNARESAAMVTSAGDAVEAPGSEHVATQPGDSGDASRSSDSVATVTTESTAVAGASVSQSVPLDSQVIVSASRADGGDRSDRETLTRDATDTGADDARRDTDNDGDQSSLGDSLAIDYEVDASRSEPLPPPLKTVHEGQSEIRVAEPPIRPSSKAESGALDAHTGDEALDQQPVPPQPLQQQSLHPQPLQQHRISDYYKAERQQLSGGASSSSSPPVDDYSVTETHFESYHSSPGGLDEGRRDAVLSAEPASTADDVHDPEPAVDAKPETAATAAAAAHDYDDAADGGGKDEMGAISLDGANGSGDDKTRRVLQAPDNGSGGGGEGGAGGGLAKEERNATERTGQESSDEAGSIATVAVPMSADFHPEAAGTGREDS